MQPLASANQPSRHKSITNAGNTTKMKLLCVIAAATTAQAFAPTRATTPTVCRGGGSELQAVKNSAFVFVKPHAVTPPTIEALKAQEQQSHKAGKAKAPSTSSTALSISSESAASVVSSLVTVTINGTLANFDSAAFMKKLAARLDMKKECFRVRSVNRGGRTLQEVQTSKSVFVLVDVDEEGYLRYEASRSTSSGDDASSVASIDDEQKIFVKVCLLYTSPSPRD